MFDGQGSQMRVGDHVARGADVLQELAQHVRVTPPGVDDGDLRLRQPADDQVQRLSAGQRRGDQGFGAQPYEPQQDDSGQGHCLAAGQDSLETGARPVVPRRLFVVRVQQQVEVDELHLRSASSRTTSSSSS